MIKLIEFDEVRFYSVVLASMEWVNSLIYKPGIFFGISDTCMFCFIYMMIETIATFTYDIHGISPCHQY